MTAYWVLFFLVAFAAILSPAYPAFNGSSGKFAWVIFCSMLALIVGFRHQVGGDWYSYLGHYVEVGRGDFFEFGDVIDRGDFGYYGLLRVFSKLDTGVHFANFFYAIVFVVGLASFCRAQPLPWLALAVSIPYLVIVVGMGYTRQSVAIGLAMLGLVSISRKKIGFFVFWVALAALFHKSAILLIPLVVLATPRGKLVTALWVGVSTLFLYDLILADRVDGLVTNYIDAGYSSDGAALRISMNVVPAVLLLLFRKRFRWGEAERNFWVSMSLLAVFSVIWLLLSPSSTAVDRVALYMIPLQIYVFARLPGLLFSGSAVQGCAAAIMSFYGLVQFVWLFFASHSQYWVPYQFYPLVLLGS